MSCSNNHGGTVRKSDACAALLKPHDHLINGVLSFTVSLESRDFKPHASYWPCPLPNVIFWDKMATLVFSSSHVKLKNCMPRTRKAPKKPNTENVKNSVRVGGKPKNAILNFFKLQILLFFFCFLKSYMISVQCYEGNIFLVAPPSVSYYAATPRCSIFFFFLFIY